MYCFVFPYLFSIADCLKNTTKYDLNLVFLTIILKHFCANKQIRFVFLHISQPTVCHMYNKHTCKTIMSCRCAHISVIQVLT